MNLRQEMRSMNRESKNGYEVCFMMHSLDAAHYRWELARYPLDINRIDEPTETLIAFESRPDNRKTYWEDAIAAAKKYLMENPDDGFCDW